MQCSDVWRIRLWGQGVTVFHEIYDENEFIIKTPRVQRPFQWRLTTRNWRINRSFDRTIPHPLHATSATLLFDFCSVPHQNLHNFAARNSQSFAPPVFRNSGCADLISSYNVPPPPLSPGFHVNAGKPPTRPPRPQPRTSLMKEEDDSQQETVSGFVVTKFRRMH